MVAAPPTRQASYAERVMPRRCKPPRRQPFDRKGGFGFTELCKYLGLNEPGGHALCDAVGVKLRPYVRDDGVVKRVYKRFYDPITVDEARLLIAERRRQQGARILARAAKLTSVDPPVDHPDGPSGSGSAECEGQRDA